MGLGSSISSNKNEKKGFISSNDDETLSIMDVNKGCEHVNEFAYILENQQSCGQYHQNRNKDIFCYVNLLRHFWLNNDWSTYIS